MGDGLWWLIDVVAPIVFGVALIWAMLHNRRSAAEKKRTEQATRELYEQTERDRQRTEGDGG